MALTNVETFVLLVTKITPAVTYIIYPVLGHRVYSIACVCSFVNSFLFENEKIRENARKCLENLTFGYLQMEKFMLY